MKGLQVLGERRASVVDLDLPSHQDGWQRVDVEWAAICGTDRKIARRGFPVGRTLGHEISGRDPWGRAVAVHPDTGCGLCDWCLRGWSNRCADKVSIGIDVDGGIAESVYVPPSHVVPIEGIPPRLGPLLEPLACCLHAIAVSMADEAEEVIVVGAGAMGMLMMWALQAEGKKVTIVQRSATRRRLARELGADNAVETFPHAGAELVFVTVPGAEAIEEALSAVRAGGTVHAFAGTPSGAQVDVNPVHYRHLRLVGSTGSGLADFSRGVELQRTGALNLSRLPHTEVPLEESVPALLNDPDPLVMRTLVRVTQPEE